jgi:four helix bundle protein
MYYFLLINRLMVKNMKEENVIQKKCFSFSVLIVGLCKFLKDEKKDYIISKQLLRCGTSIGANLEEGIGCQTKKDFYFRMTIAYKEARETYYWLRVLKETKMIDQTMIDVPILNCEEILKIIGTILKTLRKQQSFDNS